MQTTTVKQTLGKLRIAIEITKKKKDTGKKKSQILEYLNTYMLIQVL